MKKKMHLIYKAHSFKWGKPGYLFHNFNNIFTTGYGEISKLNKKPGKTWRKASEGSRRYEEAAE